MVCKDETLLPRRDALFDANQSLDVVDSVGCLNDQSEGLVCGHFDEDQHAFAEHKVECGVLLDVVVRQRPSILKLLVLIGQPLLVQRNSFLALDLKRPRRGVSTHGNDKKDDDDDDRNHNNDNNYNNDNDSSNHQDNAEFDDDNNVDRDVIDGDGMVLTDGAGAGANADDFDNDDSKDD